MKTNRLSATMFGLLVAIISLGNVNAETFIVKGKVTDAADGSGIIGCTVQVKGTTRSTITNVDGEYTIRADKGEKLVFSYIGYEKQEAEVKSERLNIRLKTSSQVLEECVVVGYGTQKMVSLCGTVGHVTPGIMASRMYADGMNAEEYKEIAENNFKTVSESPLSTFSIDVDAASYSNMRRYINKGELPPADAIRTEELINYFSYDYPQPTGNDPVKITTEVGACPWNVKHRLVRIGLKAKEIPTDKLPVSNLVFLIDVSGSMYGPQRLGLVQSSLKLLVNNLRDEDRVAIVVYSGSAGEKLPSTSGSDKQKIREAIDELTAGGSTAGGTGIKLAYKMAKQNFVKGGNNRIILCTDGDFNVGVSSDEGLEKLIEQERKSGVFLTVLGYGMGNYKDSKMQVLAEKGNGNHAYIDNLQEANRVLVNEFGATMHTVAKDVKLQIEFNPSQVQAYRLIGYESRLLKDEDFTAFYEVVPAGIKSDFTGKVDALKYQKTKPAPAVTNNSKELLTVKLRYKAPDGNTSKKIEQPLIDDKKEKVSSDFRFASAVAMFGQLLRDSDFKGDATYDKVISLAKTSLDNDEKGYRREFIRLAETAEGLAKD